MVVYHEKAWIASLHEMTRISNQNTS